jgi:NAD(P)-dependent dehydrogenase (short-subunit alcohol dehydrogenase family)
MEDREQGARQGRLEGKVAVITGGASGIGRAIADRYVAEGARVVLGDLNEDLLQDATTALGDACTTAFTDVRDEAAVEAMAAAAVDHFGRLDVGVNCAGVGTFSSIPDHSVDEWDRVVDICLKGVFLSVKHEARRMREHGEGGVIINIASINARQPGEGMVAYCSAKAGVEMLTRVAALELGREGIRVCGIGPGLVDTPLTQFQQDFPALREAFLRTIPMGRSGKARDIADAALFLASDDASWVSGDTLFVDGAELTREYPRFFELMGNPG